MYPRIKGIEGISNLGVFFIPLSEAYVYSDDASEQTTFFQHHQTPLTLWCSEQIEFKIVVFTFRCLHAVCSVSCQRATDLRVNTTPALYRSTSVARRSTHSSMNSYRPTIISTTPWLVCRWSVTTFYVAITPRISSNALPHDISVLVKFSLPSMVNKRCS